MKKLRFIVPLLLVALVPGCLTQGEGPGASSSPDRDLAPQGSGVVQQLEHPDVLCRKISENQGAILGQSFVSTETGNITGIEVFPDVGSDFDNPSPATRPSILWIFDGPDPNSDLLYSQNVTLVHSGNPQQLPLTTPVPVTAGRTYSFMLDNNWCFEQAWPYYLRVKADEPGGPGPYLGGNALGTTITPFSVVNITNIDLWFRVLIMNTAPVANAGGPYNIYESITPQTVVLDATASSDPGDVLWYEWDFDFDGAVFTTDSTGPQVVLDLGSSVDGGNPYTLRTIAVRVTDEENASNIATAPLRIFNITPRASAGPGQTVYRNAPVTLTGTWTDPAEHLDDPYFWGWDANGDRSEEATGLAEYGTPIVRETSFAAPGRYRLSFRVGDKDGQYNTSFVDIDVVNRPPDCSATAPSAETLWPADRTFVPIDVLGATDPDGDPVAITIDSIRQDEPVDARVGGSTTPDGQGIGSSTAEVRAERIPSENGRVYTIGFTARDPYGASCSGTVNTAVPKFLGDAAVDDGPTFDSTQP